MPYSTGKAPKKYTYIDSDTGRKVTMKAKQTLPGGKTVYAESFEKRGKNYAKPQRGAKVGTGFGNALKSVFGKKTKTSTGAVIGNQRKKAKSIMAEKLQRQNKCTPNSKSKSCGPGR